MSQRQRAFCAAALLCCSARDTVRYRDSLLSIMNRLPFQATRRLFSSSSSGAAGVSNIPQTLYKNVWRKSTILYITYIVTGCVFIEAVYGGVTNSLWDNYNRGVSNATFFSSCRNSASGYFRSSQFFASLVCPLRPALVRIFAVAETVQADRLDQVQVGG